MADDEYAIRGCHGTIAPQSDEAYYDDRSDASDDMEKGRLKFPTKVYGRERELDVLHNIYNKMVNSTDILDNSIREETGKGGEEEEEDMCTSCVFLGGYSGIGKSELVNQFIKQTQEKHINSTIINASGKYTEQSNASAPFSAITEVLESLASDLTKDEEDKTVKKRGLSYEQKAKIWDNIKQSDLIGPNTEGNRILRKTFPGLTPLLDSVNTDGEGESEEELDSSATRRNSIQPSMNAIKSSTACLLSIISETLDQPLIIFLDDLQWGDAPSFDMLTFLLSSSQLKRVMFICAYRSNEVDGEHLFTKLMNDIPTVCTHKMDLFSLSPDAIKCFIADSVKKEDCEKEVAELSEAVYEKTMGNIFFTMQALEELVRKNILFYDMMCFEWRWVVKKVDLAEYMSNDVVESVKGKLKELPKDVQHLLVVMSYVTHNSLDIVMLRALMSSEERKFDEQAVKKVLKSTTEESMLMSSVENGNYRFAHDRIRQASVEYAAEKNEDFSLPLYISQVLMDFGESPKMEWCLFNAVDLLNSLPPNKTNRSSLIDMNIRVAKIARSKGSREKENELLHTALNSLRSSGIMWKGKHYELTLELYNAAIDSDFSLGNYDEVKHNISIVLNNATSAEDMLLAYLRKLLTEMEETKNYTEGVAMAVDILNKYNMDIPKKITKAYIVKEEVKLKLAMRNKSYSCLADLPLCHKTYDPLFALFRQLLLLSMWTGNDDLKNVAVWKAIQFAIKEGMGRDLPTIVGFYALSNIGKVQTAQELGNVAVAMLDKLPGDVEIRAFTNSIVYGCVLPQLQPFASSLDPLAQAHKDLKLVGGDVDSTFGSMLGYFECYFAAGLELGPLLESKLSVVEELATNLDRSSWVTSFQIYRQFALNLRKRMDKPTEFQGEAFNEEKELSDMIESKRKMAFRDSCSKRLNLAFVFWDEEVMIQMLDNLKDYPTKDMAFPRIYNRLCYTGLAIFALGNRKECASFAKLGKSCLSYFENLTKCGSVNAKPVYLFMLALKSPSRDAFQKAIDACGTMVHLEAMINERYAAFLMTQNDEAAAKECITSSFWLYQDVGYHSKALQLSQQHSYLKCSKRKTANSATLSTADTDKSSTVFSFNSTFKRSSRINVKK